MTRPTDTRLKTELQRLYLLPGRSDPADAAAADATTPALQLLDGQGRTRALVLEVAAPADWERLGAVWRGVQADWGWPAPAIAASGTDGLQLWFSLAEPVAPARAQALLQQLRQHHLHDLPPARVRCWPRPDTSAQAGPSGMRHAPLVPAPVAGGEHWSAFVAPDLAPLFAETPFLDIPPGSDGQATLLAGLRSLTPVQLDTPGEPECSPGGTRLTPARPDGPQDTQVALPPASPEAAPGPAGPPPGAVYTDPQDFLRAVMNDTGVPMALRIEAAKALMNARPGG